MAGNESFLKPIQEKRIQNNKSQLDPINSDAFFLWSRNAYGLAISNLRLKTYITVINKQCEIYVPTE